MKNKFILIGLLAAGSVHAQPSSILITGQELYTRLTTMPVWAYGYIAGVADAQSGVTICIPPHTVTVGQMGDMIKQSLERVPSERHLAADIYVQVTLSNRWPCARRGSGI